MKNVELARVLEKRAERNKLAGKEVKPSQIREKKRPMEGEGEKYRKRPKISDPPAGRKDDSEGKLKSVLGNVF